MTWALMIFWLVQTPDLDMVENLDHFASAELCEAAGEALLDAMHEAAPDGLSNRFPRYVCVQTN